MNDVINFVHLSFILPLTRYFYLKLCMDDCATVRLNVNECRV
jgi:hypothetical protein